VNSDLARLLDVQARDSELARIESVLRALPARLTRVEERLSAAKAALEAHRERLLRLATQRRGGEQEVEALLAQERKFQNQTTLVKTNEELWALKREIEQVQARRSELETGVLEHMEEEQVGRRETARLEGRVSEVAAEVEREAQAVAAERARLAAEQERVAAERAALAAGVSPELKARYERVRAGRGDPGVVSLVRGACGGCLTAQPPQRVNEVRQGELLVVCEFCGRLIVGMEGEGQRPA
jgi:hypothetical protein